MTEMTTVEETCSRIESELTNVCRGTIDRVELTILGTVEIDVFDCVMSDLDAIDALVGVSSVERNPSGSLTIESGQQIAPCGGGQ